MAKRTPQQAPTQWEKVPTPPFLGEAKVFDSFPGGDLRCIVSKDEGRWHLSMSHRSRYPTWDEMADARYRFIPNRAQMAMLAPPREEFVNVHDTTLHLWEAPELAEEGASRESDEVQSLREALARTQAELATLKGGGGGRSMRRLPAGVAHCLISVLP